MKALVIGLGSMGRRRIRCLRALGVQQISGYERQLQRAVDVEREQGITLLPQLAASDLAAFDLVLVCTPPDQHHQYLQWAIEAGRSCFVEASVIREPLPALAVLARQRGSVVAPSCTLRFHTAIRDISEIVRSGRYGRVCNFSHHCGQYLPDWHPWEAVSDYYVSNPLTGGAREIVPFELTWMVDALGWPEMTSGARARTADVGADIDDSYGVLLHYPQALGMLMVDVVARQATRRLNLNLERATVRWDWDEGAVHVYEAERQRVVDLHQPVTTAHVGYHKNISEAMYVDEIANFLDAHAGRRPFAHSLEDDIRVLQLLEAAEANSDRLQSMRESALGGGR